MNRWVRVVVVLGLGAVAILVGVVFRHSFTPTVLWWGTDQDIRAAAVATAQADLASNAPRLAVAGTIAANPVGIDWGSRELLADLPTFQLPSGCTHPLADESITYAHAYNEVIAGALACRHGQHPNTPLHLTAASRRR